MKKYLLISEVAELLNVPMANLRYLESTHPKIQIQKIRGRRYYKESDVTKIADALGILYEAKSPVKSQASIYTSKKPVVTTSVSLVKAPVHSVAAYKPNLPMIEEKHGLAEYESHLPMIAEKNEVEAYKENLPQIAEKHEIMQLDLFAKMKSSQDEKVSAPTLPLAPSVSNDLSSPNPTLELAKKRMEEIRDRLKKVM